MFPANDTLLKKRIQQIIEAKGTNVTQLSKRIGVSQKTLHNQINADTQVSGSTILLILQQFPDVSAEWLLRGNGKMLIKDNMPPFNGDESDNEITLHAELTRATMKADELTATTADLQNQIQDKNQLILKLQSKVEIMKELINDTINKKINLS